MIPTPSNTNTSTKRLIQPIRPCKAFRRGSLHEINTKRIHIHAIQKGAKALGEAGQALMHQLQMEHVGLQISQAIT